MRNPLRKTMLASCVFCHKSLLFCAVQLTFDLHLIFVANLADCDKNKL